MPNLVNSALAGALGGAVVQKLKSAGAFSLLVDGSRRSQWDGIAGGIATVNGSPTIEVDGSLGRVVDFAGFQSMDWAAHAMAANADVTTIAICRVDASSTYHGVLCTSSSGASYFMQIVGATALLYLTKAGVADINSALQIPLGVPVLLAASSSINAGKVNFVARRLDTGAIQSATVSNSSASTAGNGTFRVGYTNSSSESMNGAVAAAFVSRVYLSLNELVDYSADPFALFRAPARRVYRMAQDGAAAGLQLSRRYYDMVTINA